MKRIVLMSLLARHDIPLEKWGIGKAKTLDHLVEEVASGEVMIEEKDGVLLRSLYISALIVYYTDGKRTKRLVEDRQVFLDGRVRKRKREISIGEKMRPGEDPQTAAYRALKEELGVNEQLPLKPLLPLIKGPAPSETYPGLMARHYMHQHVVWLPDHHFRPRGYVEKQKDKTNYYVWVDT